LIDAYVCQLLPLTCLGVESCRGDSTDGSRRAEAGADAGEWAAAEGSCLAETGDPAEAASWLQQAIDTARSEQAKSPELRAAIRLARLWRDQGRRAEAHDPLASVNGWFTEGFDTQDLKGLLDELP
jgi:predicted ATPase